MSKRDAVWGEIDRLENEKRDAYDRLRSADRTEPPIDSHERQRLYEDFRGKHKRWWDAIQRTFGQAPSTSSASNLAVVYPNVQPRQVIRHSQSGERLVVSRVNGTKAEDAGANIVASKGGWGGDMRIIKPDEFADYEIEQSGLD